MWTLAILVILALLVVYALRSTDNLLGKRVSTTTAITANTGGLCNASTVTAIGTVTRVSDKSTGVTWEILLANPPYPNKDDTAAKCTLRRTPADSASHIAWNLAWFGTDNVDPIANYGLQSVFLNEQKGHLSVL